MKILIIRSLNPFYEVGASANRYAGIIKGLLQNNINVTLLVTGGYKDKQEFCEKGVPADYKNLSIRYTLTTFNNSIWKRRFNKYVLSFLFNKLNSYMLKRYFKDKYDFIWLTNDTGILSAFNVHYNTIKCKTIIELNEFNDLYKSDTSGNHLQKMKASAGDKVFETAISKIDLFAVITKTLISHYQRMAKSNAVFFHFPMTVDFSRFSNVDKTDKYKKPYIAFTGTYTNKKDGVDILIKAFSKIASSYPEYHLYLAGFYYYDVPMQKKLIADLGLNERITYLNVLNSLQIPEFIYNADLLVLSRPDSRQAQGGFPTKLGEYLASGNPVCVTSVGEIPDYLKDNISAFIAVPGSVDSFSDAMNRALSDKQNAIRIGLNGKKVAEENFNIEVQIKNLIQFLQCNIK